MVHQAKANGVWSKQNGPTLHVGACLSMLHRDTSVRNCQAQSAQRAGSPAHALSKGSHPAIPIQVMRSQLEFSKVTAWLVASYKPIYNRQAVRYCPCRAR